MAFASVAGGPIPIDPYSLSPAIMKNHIIKTFMYDSGCLPPELMTLTSCHAYDSAGC